MLVVNGVPCGFERCLRAGKFVAVGNLDLRAKVSLDVLCTVLFRMAHRLTEGGNWL
ncbi:MAG: hypothetical protein ACJAUC_000030 [Planctomycetota bacterium]|jgi:hypothetical protein